MKRNLGTQFFFYRDAHVEDALATIKRHLRPQMDALGISDLTNKPLMLAALKRTVDDLEKVDWGSYVRDYLMASNSFKRSATFLSDEGIEMLKQIQKHIRATAPKENIKKGKKAPLMMGAYIALRYAGDVYAKELQEKAAT